MAKSGYYVFLKKCLLPVTPKKLKTKINSANKTVTLINDGEINILKTAELTDIEFECEIPQVQYPYAVYKSGFKDAEYYLDYFSKLKTKKKPFQFIVSRELPDGTVLFYTDATVSLEDYTITEDAGNGFDLTVNIKLKHYREYGTETVTIKATSSGTSAKSKKSRKSSSTSDKSDTSKSKKYTVKKGDCLWAIAKKYYGDGSKYTTIYNANKSTIGSNPNLIYAGQVLTIPALS